MNISKLQKLNSAFNQGCTFIASKTPWMKENGFFEKKQEKEKKKVGKLIN